MEMHSRQSLYDIHGISIERRRRRSRQRESLVARLGAFLTKVKRAIEAQRAIRRAVIKLAEMDDRYASRSGSPPQRIEDRLRRPQVYFENG